MHLNKKDIQKLDRIYRLNLINCVTGIKSANLIGSKDSNGHSNLAIFSSVTHLGSHPALLGIVVRPTEDVPRNTYDNIIKTGYYSINHVPQDLIEKAHKTSAKFDSLVSEFEECQIEEQWIKSFPAPFVKMAKVKIGMKFLEELEIQRNHTRLLIGEIQELYVEDDCINEQGLLNLEKSQSIGVGGLNSYYQLNHLAQYPYARVGDIKK